MTKLAVLAAAAGILLAAPSLSTVASADPVAGVQVAQLTVKVGRDRDRDWRRRHHHNCRTTTVWRHGKRTTIRRCN